MSLSPTSGTSPKKPPTSASPTNLCVSKASMTLFNCKAAAWSKKFSSMYDNKALRSVKFCLPLSLSGSERYLALSESKILLAVAFTKLPSTILDSTPCSNLVIIASI